MKRSTTFMALAIALASLAACGGGEPSQASTVTTSGAAPTPVPFAGWPTSEDLAKNGSHP